MNMRGPDAGLSCAVVISVALIGVALTGCSTHAPDATVAPAQTVSQPATATTHRPQASATAAQPATPGQTGTPPSFRWQVAAATTRSLGVSWRSGCPVGPTALRSVSLRYWGFDGQVHDGVIVLHHDILNRARAVFATMYQRRFPLRSVIPVSRFPRASDDASMAADNTSAFNCRAAVAAGPPSWSRHAYGKAIDVNPVENPYLFGKKVLPPAGIPYRSRSTPRPGLIRKGDPIHQKFIAAGFRWGGEFSDPDYQHFER